MATEGGANPPTRVAILGSGLGAMATAFELTATSELRRRFQVTVYQQGWRLGGKAACGRALRRQERVEEHGLHMMMGWYEHVFALLRAAYDEWERLPNNPL